MHGLKMLVVVQTGRWKWSAVSGFGLWSQEGFTEKVTFKLGAKVFPLQSGQERKLQERRLRAKTQGLGSPCKAGGSGVG